MKPAHTVPEVAALLGLSPDVTRALIVLVLGSARDLLSTTELSTVREAHARVTSKQPPRLMGAGHGPLESGRPPPSRGAPWLRPVAALDARREADDLFARGLCLEETDATLALGAYLAALAANPHHADAHVNLGRLLHQRGELREAEAHYVAALVSRPADATATFNLAVVLDDLGRLDEAIARYSEALELDPNCVDAYFNLSRLYEKKGEKLAAIRHLKDYRRLLSRASAAP